MTKYLGIYTGIVFDDASYMEECCKEITEEQANDEEFLESERAKNKINCNGCFDCHASRGDEYKDGF